jgi:hypothetical protein
LCLIGGFLMILFGYWVPIGLLLEFYGFIKIFGGFFPIALTFARDIPYVNKIVEMPAVNTAVDYVAGRTKPKYSV